MLVKSDRPHRKNNPKRQKRNQWVDFGKPKVPLNTTPKQTQGEKLRDWEDAP